MDSNETLHDPSTGTAECAEFQKLELDAYFRKKNSNLLSMMKNLHSHLWKVRAIESLKARQIQIFEVQHMQHFMLDKDCKFEADIICYFEAIFIQSLKITKILHFRKNQNKYYGLVLCEILKIWHNFQVLYSFYK